MRAPRPVLWGLASLAFLGTSRSAPAGAQVELKNDGFDGMGAAAFEGGFVTGEIAASRFTAPPGMFRVEKIRFLFGPGGGLTDVTLRIWDDNATDVIPGLEHYMGDFMITPSTSALQEIDLLPAGGVVLTGSFRVGIEFNMDAPPGIARDTDGTVAMDRNFIRADTIGWKESWELGVSGDWILRAVGRTVGGAEPAPEAAPEPPADAPVEPPAEPAAEPGDAGAEASPDAGADTTQGSCRGNGDCPVGKYCGPAGVCTLDCRMDSDCAGGKCSSLGKCIPGAKDSGGCGCRVPLSNPPARAQASSPASMLLLAALVRRWRRRR